MKKILFLLIMTGIFFGHNANSQGVEKSPDVYFVMKARPNAESSLMKIASVENNTGFPVEFEPDSSIGNDFVLETWVDGRFYTGDKEFLSNEMNGKIKNATGAVSINDLCPDQARMMRNEFNKANKFREDYLRRLAEQAIARAEDSCNCPNDPDLQNNFNRRVEPYSSGNEDYMVMTEEYGRVYYPELETNKEIKKTWFGKNWYWVVPAALVVGYAVYDGFTEGGWFDFYKSKKKTTIIIIDDDDGDGIPNDQDPDHNDNGIWNGGSIDDRPIINTALLDSRIKMKPQFVFSFF